MLMLRIYLLFCAVREPLALLANYGESDGNIDFREIRTPQRGRSGRQAQVFS
jgi:hypothetical protein